MKIKIVKPTEEDIIHMAKMIRSLFKIEKDFSSNIELHKKGVSMLMKKKNGIIYIAKYGKERIGMITGQIVISTSVGGYSVWIEDLFVKKRYRYKGIGTLLLKKLENWAIKKKVKRFSLLCDETNKNAILFYKKNSFTLSRLRAMYKKI